MIQNLDVNTVPVPGTEGKSSLRKLQGLSSPYRNDIDGLRAIAVIAVVLFHARVSLFSGGFVGVDIFFVISGYLIGAHIYRDVSQSQFSLARFYQRRAKRILPALFAVLLFCYGMSFLLLSPMEMRRFGAFAASSILSVSNIVAWHQWNYFTSWAMQYPLLMTWSLGVEEQFYIFFPMLMLLLWRLSRSKGRNEEQNRKFLFRSVLLVAVFSCALSVMATLGDSTVGIRYHWLHVGGASEAFYLLPYRAWELAAGVLMALYEARANGIGEASNFYGGSRFSDLRGAAGAAALLVSIFLYGPSTIFPGGAAILPVIGAVLVLSAPDAWLNRKILSSKPFRWIGLVSYSWYLWHWPLLSFGNIVTDKPLASGTMVLLALVTLGFACLSYRFIEQPFRNSKTRTAPMLWRYAAACFVFAIPGLFMVLSRGVPSRVPELAAVERPVVLEDHGCFGHEFPQMAEECVPKPDGRPAVAVLGDSHAVMIAPALTDLATESGMRLLTVSHAACAPLIGVIQNVPGVAFDPSCGLFNRAALKLLASDPTVRTVVLGGQWASPAVNHIPGYGYVPTDSRHPVSVQESEANLEQGLEAMISALKRAGKRVIVLQDINTLKFDPQRRVRTFQMPVRQWMAQLLQGPESAPGAVANDEMYAKENAAAAAVVARVARKDNVETFDLRSHLCRAATCMVYGDGHLVYVDDNHVSRKGAEAALAGFPLLDPRNRNRHVKSSPPTPVQEDSTFLRNP
jgi:peptidoglycan/LPS O-acetylase OafA/YrhL